MRNPLAFPENLPHLNLSAYAIQRWFHRIHTYFTRILYSEDVFSGSCSSYNAQKSSTMEDQSRNHDTWSEVEDFCYALGGKKPIHSILIANNGMAAAKFIRSVRTWALETFGTEKAILLVAMATPEDLMINAEHVRIADQFVQVPGGTNNNNYANVHLILETAEMTHVDAVWPGWGHASENPELPEALSAKGIIFLGPPASSMAALGDKIGSSLIAQAVGIPTLPWSGSHVKNPYMISLLEPIPDNVYRQACIYTTEEALASCRLVGYPAMIKASWGGGGKGIRKVHNDDEVESAFKQVQGEVHGSPIFIMKVASESRHLEVQLLCDQYGNVAALHSRDCSVQRRHQKIIEEGPITVAPLETVKKLEQAARRLAKCVNYVGAATVEYLYSMDTGDYFFLELNPRLQVEHPITEWIAEINLPAAQVSVAMGIPLWQIPEIRQFYGMDHNGGYDAWKRTSIFATSFDFDKGECVRTKGHCVAVRITCEDPDHGFKPTGGKVQELSFKSKPNVWAYFSIKSGGGIHQFSDSQFGHIFAFGKSRALAIANMVLGLKEIHIKGEIHTNIDYILDLLYASEYKYNQIHTDWLDRRIAMRVRAERPPWYLSVVGGALYKAVTHSTTMVSDYVAYLEKGQIPPKQIALVHSQISLNVEGRKYTIDMIRSAPQSYTLRMNQSEILAETHTLSDGGLLMQLDGNSHVIYAEEVAAGTRLSIDGRTCLLQNDHDPSQLVVETPCKLLRFLVSDGSHLNADTPYAEIEVMKMQMPLLLPASGAIHFKITEGQAMQTGDLIARLDLDDPSAIRKAEPFQGSFPLLGPPTAVSVKVHQRFAASLNAARMILAGYEHNVDKVIQDLISCMDSSELPFLQWQESMAVLATRLPKDLKDELNMKFKGYEGISNSSRNVEFPAKLLQGVLMAHLSSCPHKDKSIQESLLDPLMTLVKSYEGGLETHARVVVHSLFEEYLSTEKIFSAFTQADMIEHLRLQPKKDLHKVVDIVLSHQSVHKKNKLILRLMEAMVYPNSAAYRDKLIRFSSLNHRSHSELALKARQLVEHIELSELRCSTARSLSVVEMFTEEGEHVDTATRKSYVDEMMKDLVRAPLPVEDVLVGLFDNTNRMLQMRVVETYIRRLYQCYLVKGSIQMQWPKSGLIAYWKFSEEHIETRNKLNDENFSKPIVDKHQGSKWGAMIIVKTLQLLPMVICAALNETNRSSESKISNPCVEPVGHGNVLHIALVGMNSQISVLQDSGNEDDLQENINKLVMLLEEKQVGSALRSAGVGVISFIIQSGELSPPVRHSFHWSLANLSYEEAPLYRHLEPPLSSFLELEKLEAFENIQYSPSLDRQWHMYTIVDKRQPIQRMFLRTLVRQYKTSGGLSSYQGEDSRTVPPLSRCILRSLIAALEELDLHGKIKIVRADHLHMYLCLVHEQQIDDLVSYPRKVDTMVGQEEYTVGKILEELAHKIHELVGVKMYRLGVSEWEVKFWMASAGLASGAWRIVVSDVTVHTCTVHTYREVEGPDHKVVYHSVFNELGPMHGVSTTAHYKPLGVLEQKRLLARKKNTTYCYDFPLAFQMGLQRSWRSLHPSTPSTHKPKDKYLLKARELIFANKEGCWDTPLVSVERPPALNDVGMVAWCMDMSTPEFPNGRTVFVIANDITFRSGSFGPKEYSFFCAVSNLACSKKLPLIYLAANSGVHVQVAEKVKACFRVGWSDESIPECGFQYLYLTPEDHKHLGSAAIGHEIKMETGETRWVIDAISAEEMNLTGTGAVAGAYLRAYKETFTLTYVTGPTVGIGAYLARFGMRCIQRLDQPIVLTGFAALNKLLGRTVYSSHMQLGGPKIMTTNGVVHLTVGDDLEGISAILKWLGYVPPYVGGPLPILNPLDSPERLVKYFPEKSCDPRAAICGVQDSKGAWLGGIFDKDSFVETLGGWAQTVVTGRAKLGGIPIGIIAAETKTVMQVIPADPGQLDSHERIVPQAGQLWFPDSATKTSQSILDFNREELPLFVMANWRGFSGGQKDLFEGILQAGSAILENLRTYKQPVFMYIPMMGELRGGAWVVADSTNNPDHIEIYGETTSKGNILEPEGLIEIKFRTKELLECMGRLDLQLVSLKGALQEARASGNTLTFEALQEKIRSREKRLLPIYTRIATRFAELHETSTTMVATGVIKEVVDWENSRSFFYRRLRRKLSEGSLMRVVIETAGDQLSHKSAMELIKKWFLASKSVQDGEDTWLDDEEFFTWKDDPRNYEEYLEEVKVQNVLFHLSRIGESSSGLLALLQGLPALLSKVDASRLEQLIEELRKVLSR